MKNILITKVGRTMPPLASRRGDFEDWILAGMQVDKGQAKVVDVLEGDTPPSYDEISGVVITGSHAMVTDHEDWSEGIADWLPGAIERGIPILGICYGHQLLAYAAGGEVGDNPNGLEVGTVKVHLRTASKDDLLFGPFPNPIRVHASHTQSVLSLPPGAQLLASSAMDPHHAFVLGERAWGVQFHPEFDAEILIEYLRRDSRRLQTQGIDPEMVRRASTDTPYGPQVLKRFAKIVEEVAGPGS
jgi:GMP synthase (glutamine-hydrolysing)